MSIPLGTPTYHPTLAVRYQRTYPNSMTFAIRVAGTLYSKVIAAGDYWIRNNSLSSIDLLNKIQNALDDIWSEQSLLGEIEVGMDRDGRVTFARNANLQTITLDTATWHNDLVRALGFNHLSPESISLPIDGSPVAAIYLADNQWVPGIQAVYDSGDEERELIREVKGLTGIPYRNSFSDAWFEREILWEMIAAARTKNSRISNSNYTDPACLTVNDPNAPFENLISFLKGARVGPNPGQVRIFSSPDLSDSTLPPAYYVSLADSGLLERQIDRDKMFDGGIEAYDLMLSMRRVL